MIPPLVRPKRKNPLLRTRLPLLVLIGAADDWTPAAPCSELIADAKAKGHDFLIERAGSHASTARHMSVTGG